MLFYFKMYKKTRDWWLSRKNVGGVAFGGAPDVVIFVIVIPAIVSGIFELLFGKYLDFGKNEFGIVWVTLMGLVIIYLNICNYRDR